MAKFVGDRDNGNGTYTHFYDDGTYGTYRFSDHKEVERGYVDLNGDFGKEQQDQKARDKAKEEEKKAKDKAAKKATDDAKKKSEDAKKQAQDWDKYLDEVMKKISTATGFEREKLEMQFADAQKQRDNAWKIAQYQADIAAKTAAEQLAFQKGKWQDEKDLQTWSMSGYMGDGTSTLDRQKFEEEIAFKKNQWAQQYELDLRKQGFTEEEARWQRQQDEKKLNIDTRIREAALTGTYNGQMTEDAQKWRAQLGLDATKTAAQLSQSPENWFEAGAFYDAASKQGYIGDAASLLRSNLSSGGGGAVTPRTNSLDNVMNNLMPQEPQYSTMPVALQGGYPQGGYMETFPQGQTRMHTGQMPTDPVKNYVQDGGGMMYAGGSPGFNERYAGSPTQGYGQSETVYAGGSSGFNERMPMALQAQTNPYSTMTYQGPGTSTSPYSTPPASAGGALAPTGVESGTTTQGRYAIRPAVQRPVAQRPAPAQPAASTTTGWQASGVKQQQDAFANEAAKLATQANKWDVQQWQSYSPTKQGLLKSAWKSKGLNPDDVLYKFQTSGVANDGAGRAA